jgi:solute:Na+ symporter, SSS family
MAVIDWIIVAIYAISTIALGAYFSRRQVSTKDYFIGSGAMNPVLIGVSLFATLLSTITYLAIPGEISGKGPIYLTNYLSYPFVFLVLGFVILPVYMRQQVTSAYELLEERLGVSVRLLGASMFLLLRLVWMALLVYLTAKAIAIMIGAPEAAIPLIVMVTGFFAIVYTSLGGLRAVVITDLMQTILLYGGALLVIGTVTWKMGGFGWFPTAWPAGWDEQPLFSLDPSTRVTVFGSFLSVFLWMIATMAGDQVSVQRFMATKDAKAARRALGMQLTVSCIVGVTLGFVGLALLGYFEAFPQLLPEASGVAAQADKLFPHFIAFELPPVIAGLVVAGLFAAAMSSIDSGVNSITAVVMSEVVSRTTGKEIGAQQQVALARWMAVIIGTIVVVGSGFMDQVPGNFMAVTNKIVNLFTVPIALLFFFALFVPFANARGVWVGTIASVLTAGSISFSGVIFGVDPVTGLDPVSFQWISPAALVVGVTVGLTACYVFKTKRA